MYYYILLIFLEKLEELLLVSIFLLSLCREYSPATIVKLISISWKSLFTNSLSIDILKHLLIQYNTIVQYISSIWSTPAIIRICTE